MPFNGDTWNESSPTNADVANEIDDNFRDLKVGLSGRLRKEHIWPASQTNTSEAGPHLYVTLYPSTAAPTLPIVGTTTQVAGIWASSGSQAIMIIDSVGNNYTLMSSGKGLNIIGAYYSATGSVGDVVIGGANGLTKVAPAATRGDVFISRGTTSDASFMARRAVNAWVTFSGGNASIYDSFNVSGVTKTASGVYQVTFATGFLDTKYAIFLSAGDSSQSPVCYHGTKGTTTIVVNVQANGGVGLDASDVSLIAVGSA